MLLKMKVIFMLKYQLEQKKEISKIKQIKKYISEQKVFSIIEIYINSFFLNSNDQNKNKYKKGKQNDVNDKN